MRDGRLLAVVVRSSRCAAEFGLSTSTRSNSVPEPLSWDAFLQAIRQKYPDLYRTWFTALQPEPLSGGELRIRVDDPAHLHYLRSQCMAAFVQTVMAITGHLVTVRFFDPHHDDTRIVVDHPMHDAHMGDVQLSADYTFEQFVVGPSNRLAHAACKAVCNQLGTLYNPLFIHGATGLGKTHLLHATCSEVLRRNPTSRVIYTSCERFVNDFVQAIESGDLQPFRLRARRADVLVIDDIQFLANRESSQEELFHTFNALYQAQRQIILSADASPSDIPTLEDRLVSRFNWGLVAQIDPPNRETRQAILRKKARIRGVEIPAEVLDFIAAHVEANVRILEGALTKLITECQLAGHSMTVETARQILPKFDPPRRRPLQISDIQEAVAKHFGIRVQELLSRKRTRSISHPRQIAMYLARKLTPLSLEEIGMHFGGRDHSTVLHAQRAINADRVNDHEVAEALTVLTRQLVDGPAHS